MLTKTIEKIINREDLSEQEAYDAMDFIMSGKSTDSQIGAFLAALRMKGENASEITGFARAMKDKAIPVELNSNYVIDTCGTGGDGGRTFNVSTAVAIIAAAGGVKVAKHGNRAVSGKSGSADVLEKLGYNINLTPEEVKKNIEEKNMGFIFAQKYHAAMKNAAGPRKELGMRTVFNILGPLTNPAQVKGQVLGVYDKKLTHIVAQVLSNLGCERAMVVCSEDGLDEITVTSKTYVSELNNSEIHDYLLNPEDFEISISSIQDIRGGSAEENAEIIKQILKGIKGSKRDIVVINSAAALYVGKACETMKDGIKMAQNIIDSGAAYRKLQELSN